MCLMFTVVSIEKCNRIISKDIRKRKFKSRRSCKECLFLTKKQDFLKKRRQLNLDKFILALGLKMLFSPERLLNLKSMNAIKIIHKASCCVLFVLIIVLSGCGLSIDPGPLGGEIKQVGVEPPRNKIQQNAGYDTGPVVFFSFDPKTNLGTLSVDIRNKGIEVRNLVIKNIGDICSSYNVALEAGKVPPKGSHYEILGDSVDNGILTIEFKALY